jgi:hypothetical protein
VADEGASDKAAAKAYREEKAARQTAAEKPVIAPRSTPKAPSGGGGSKAPAKSSSTPSRPSTAQPSLNQDELAQQYSLTSGMINAFPELKVLFDQAVREGWTSDKFQAKLRNTEWYKTRSDTQRKAAIMQYQDPASWGQLWNTTQSHVRDLMADMGADANNWEQINAAASKIIWDGYNDNQARDFLGQYIVFGSSGLAGGKAGAAQQELNTYAYQMGVQNADWWQQDAIRNIMRGQKTVQDYKNEIMTQSIAAFPGLEKQLRAGSTLADLAQPYTQSMSQILEIPSGNINMFDPTIRNALSYRDPSGTAASKPLWQFQNDLRGDERWKKTQNAQDAAMGTAHSVLQSFGMVS